MVLEDLRVDTLENLAAYRECRPFLQPLSMPQRLQLAAKLDRYPAGRNGAFYVDRLMPRQEEPVYFDGKTSRRRADAGRICTGERQRRKL